MEIHYRARALCSVRPGCRFLYTSPRSRLNLIYPIISTARKIPHNQLLSHARTMSSEIKPVSTDKACPGNYPSLCASPFKPEALNPLWTSSLIYFSQWQDLTYVLSLFTPHSPRLQQASPYPFAQTLVSPPLTSLSPKQCPRLSESSSRASSPPSPPASSLPVPSPTKPPSASRTSKPY